MNTTVDQTIELLSEFANSQAETYQQSKREIYCFTERIDEVKISRLINQHLPDIKNLFYFSKPDDDFEFITLGQFSELGDNEISFGSILNKFNSFKRKIKFNKTVSESDSFPLFQCQVKFNSMVHSDVWKQFPRFSFSIPEFIFYRNKSDFRFIHIFSDPVKVDFRLIENLFGTLNKPDYGTKNNNSAFVQYQNVNLNEQKENWGKQISKGKEYFKTNELKKFVLSREQEFYLSDKPDFNRIIGQLKTTYPSCFIFLNKIDEKTFFGASPESFIKSSNDKFIFEAVAGSVPRGNHISEELTFEKRLLLDPKLKSEHEIVRDFIFEKVSKLSKDNTPSEKSFVRKLDNIQHLVTKISIKPNDKNLLFKYIGELFPTPAICGSPREKALKVIHELETYDRGLYSGLLGWLDINLNGELVVGIRSALSEGNKITAFAGGGILADSDAEEEFFETELKLQPILSLFKNEKES